MHKLLNCICSKYFWLLLLSNFSCVRLSLCDPIDGSPLGSSVPGILQAKTLEWVAISFSNAWKWKVKVKSLSHVLLFATPGLQHTRLPSPSPTPGACSNLSSSSQWCHPNILASVFPFSCLQSFSKSESFPMSQFFASGGQVLEFQLQHQSFQWIFRTDFL